MHSDVCHIPLGLHGRYEAVVSVEDYAFLTQWRWTFKRSRGGKVYARRHRRVEGQRETVLMHNVVLLERMQRERPTPKHTGDHRNRNSLDNTRNNLKWATKREQGINRVFAPRRPSIAQEEIPF